jgi:hypothetical protein
LAGGIVGGWSKDDVKSRRLVDCWTLDLTTFTWKKHISSVMPVPLIKPRLSIANSGWFVLFSLKKFFVKKP